MAAAVTARRRARRPSRTRAPAPAVPCSASASARIVLRPWPPPSSRARQRSSKPGGEGTLLRRYEEWLRRRQPAPLQVRLPLRVAALGGRSWRRCPAPGATPQRALRRACVAFPRGNWASARSSTPDAMLLRAIVSPIKVAHFDDRRAFEAVGCKSFHLHTLPAPEPARWTQQVLDRTTRIDEDLDLGSARGGRGGHRAQGRGRVRLQRSWPRAASGRGAAGGGGPAPARLLQRAHAADGAQALSRSGDDHRHRQRGHPRLRGARGGRVDRRQQRDVLPHTGARLPQMARGARAHVLHARLDGPVLRTRRSHAARRACALRAHRWRGPRRGTGRGEDGAPSPPGGSQRAGLRRARGVLLRVPHRREALHRRELRAGGARAWRAAGDRGARRRHRRGGRARARGDGAPRVGQAPAREGGGRRHRRRGAHDAARAEASRRVRLEPGPREEPLHPPRVQDARPLRRGHRHGRAGIPQGYLHRTSWRTRASCSRGGFRCRSGRSPR